MVDPKTSLNLDPNCLITDDPWLRQGPVIRQLGDQRQDFSKHEYFWAPGLRPGGINSLLHSGLCPSESRLLMPGPKSTRVF